jgi:hypothetical protein
MGQQQLLLLVLGIVIVGLAVVVGIQAFSENQKKANADALVNDAVRIASDAQAWALKPAAFGGPASTEDLGDVTFNDLGYDVSSPTAYDNLNGTFALSGTAGAADALITATSINGEGNTVYVRVCGTTPESIQTAVNASGAPTC